MSADRLKEAARVLRERAEAATRGIWQARDGASWAAQVCVLDGDGHPIAATSLTESVPDAIADAAYIATMHPGVGLALADWLDGLLVRYAVPDIRGVITKYEYDAALRLADLILGAES